MDEVFSELDQPLLRNFPAEESLNGFLDAVKNAPSRRARNKAKRELIQCLKNNIESLNTSPDTVSQWLSVINDFFTQAEIRDLLAYTGLLYELEKTPLQLKLIKDKVDLQQYPNVMTACLDNLEKNLKKRCKTQKIFYHQAALNNLILDADHRVMFQWAVQLEPVYYQSLGFLRKIIFNWTHSAMKAVVEVERAIHDVVRSGDVRIFKRMLAQQNSVELILKVSEGETPVELAKRLLGDENTGVFARAKYKMIIAKSANYFCKNWPDLVVTREACVRLIPQLKALTPFQLKRVLNATSHKRARAGNVLSCLQAFNLRLDDQRADSGPTMESVESPSVEAPVLLQGNRLSKRALQALKDKLWTYFTFHRFETSAEFKKPLDELEKCDENQIEEILTYRAKIIINGLEYDLKHTFSNPLKNPYNSPLWHHISRKTLPRVTEEKTLQKTINLDKYPRVKAAMDNVRAIPENTRQWDFWKDKKQKSNARKREQQSRAPQDATFTGDNNNGTPQSTGPSMVLEI